MKSRALVLALLSFGLLFPASAQNPATGLPPFGSFQSAGFDTVNLQNLNSNFSIPIVSVPGRGSDFGFSIVFDSLLWVNQTGTTHYWVPATDPSGNPTWGWKKDTFGGVTSFKETTLRIKCGDGTWNYKTTQSGYSYRDVLGTVHSFSVSVIDNGCTGTETILGSQYASDASGYYIDLNQGAVINPGGLISPFGGSASGSATDTNGNLITKIVVNSTENDWTDTAGHTVLKVITGANSIQYHYQDTSGSYQHATLNLSPYTIKTYFQCSNVQEYTGTSTVNLPTSLDLPNGKSYTFTYEQTPGSGSGYTTGRVQRVTLPTGGYYEFDYTGSSGNDSINCADGTTTDLTRVVNDRSTSATWHFVRTSISGSSGTTTITAPLLPYDANANQTVATFDTNGHETSRKIYQGNASGSPLRTVNTTWATNGTPSTRVTILNDGSTQSETDTRYDNNGNLTQMSEYDWYGGSRGSLIRTTSLSYLGGTAYTTRNIVNRVTSVVVKDTSGTPQYRQDIAYDESGYINTSCPTGAAQHDDTHYGCTFTTRGNPTTVTTYKDPATPANPVAKHSYYDWFGNLRQADVDSCQQRSWTFSTITQYAYPDSTVCGASSPQLTVNFTYNSYTGQIASITDENNQTTGVAYNDSMKRLTTVTRPDNVQLTTAYDDTALTVMTTTPVTSSTSVKQTGYADGLGRSIKSVTADASGASYSILEQQYDPLGRAYKTSNPHNSTAQYWTTTQFDALGRPTTTILPDSSPTTYSYSLQTVTVTDPAGKQRKSQADGSGRLVSIYEPDINNGNQLTQQSSYNYNVLNALAGVTQGVQTRTYGYDHLGRLTSAATPESANSSITYQYNDSDLLTQRTDVRGVITTYGYDTLNRLHQISYNVGATGVPATASVTYNYGTTPSQNNNGRLITMTDGVGSETYTYEILGRMTQLQKVISGTTYTSSYSYNLASELASLTYPSTRVVQQSYDAIGRLCAIAGQTSGCSTMTNPYASGFGYNTAFEPTGFQYGNGLYASFGFSPDRLQLNCLDYSPTNRNGTCTHDGTTKLGLTYAYGSAGSNDGQIASITDSVDNGRSATYTYDPLQRLSTAVTTGSSAYPQWGLAWTYDRYGNRTAQNLTAGTAPAPLTPTDPATNHLTTSGYTYDANGNLKVEPSTPSNNNYTYDGENRLVSFANGSASGTYTYDGKNLRVKKVSGSTTTVYVFSGSKVIAEYANGSLSKEYVYSGAQLLATIAGSTTTYHHADHLSVRLSTNASGTKIGDQGHFPFGETWYLKNTTTKWQFTSYERDAESGNDYAMARYDINRVGRFSSPDLLAGSAGDPQSLGRYTYVRNDPVNAVDPLGLDYCLPTELNCVTGGEGSGDGYCPPWFGGPCQGGNDIGTDYYVDGEKVSKSAANAVMASGAGEMVLFEELVPYGKGDWPEQLVLSLLTEGVYSVPDLPDLPSDPSGGDWGSCSQGSSGTFGSFGASSVFGVFGAHAFGQSNQSGSSKKGSNSCAANNGAPQPQQRHAQQQELLNKKCAAANMASGALWVTAGMNEGAAWLTGGITPFSAFFHGIALGEGIAAGGMSIYAGYVCYQATQ
jgi:RHS repeat-associated protein